MAPDFLPDSEYPKKPFGMFFVIGALLLMRLVKVHELTLSISGNDFRGFHLRFRDVARGGIRIVKSRNAEWVSLGFLRARMLTGLCIMQKLFNQPTVAVSCIFGIWLVVSWW